MFPRCLCFGAGRLVDGGLAGIYSLCQRFCCLLKRQGVGNQLSVYRFIFIRGYGMFRSRYGGLYFVLEFTFHGSFFGIFFVKFERVFKLFLLTALVGFFVSENVIPRLYFGSVVFFFDLTRWSVICPAEFLVIYTERSLESTEKEFLRLDSLVLGVRPKCNLNGIF